MINFQTDEVHIPNGMGMRPLHNRAPSLGKMESLLKKNLLRYWRNFGYWSNSKSLCHL